MNKKEFKELVNSLLKSEVEDVSPSEKIILIKKAIFEYDQNIDRIESNKGNSWTDDELRIVLSIAPTKENLLLIAKAFKRGYGSIEQIIRWASEDQASINKKRPDDSFIKQIKKVASEVGWRAT